MKSEYQALLETLIRCTPVTPDVAKVNQAADCMADFLAAKGVRVVREDVEGRRVVYASTLPSGKKSDYIVNAHLDVVPLASAAQGIPAVRDGLIYGRGAGDCLGHAVCAAQLLVENPSASLAGIFTLDEEEGGKTTAAMLERGYEAAKGVVILDSWGQDAIVVAEKGMMDVQLTAHGKSGHAAYPWQAENALDLLMAGYEKLRQSWVQPTADHQWVDSLSVTGITCDSTAHNVIPGLAVMNCNIRFVTPGDEQKILERIRQVTGLDDVKLLNTCVPVFCNENSDFVQKLKAIAERDSGRKIALQRMCGATDARHFAAKYPQIPIVIDGFRHGRIHQDGEWADLQDAERLVRIYSALFSK